MSSSTAKRCPICENTLGQRGDKQVTTECGHIHHLDCAQQCVDRRHKSDCQFCNKKWALADALRAYRTTTSWATTGQRTDQDYASEKDGRKDHSASTTRPSDVHTNGNSDNDWLCDKCTMKNTAWLNRCKQCGELRRTPSSSLNPRASVEDVVKQEKSNQQGPSHRRSEADTNENRHRASGRITADTGGSSERHSKKQVEGEHYCDDYSRESSNVSYGTFGKENWHDNASHSSSRSSNNSGSRSKVNSELHSSTSTTLRTNEISQTPPRSSSSLPKQREVTVYISNLPSAIDDDVEMENLVRRRVVESLKITPCAVQCFTKFGVGIIRVSHDQTKEYLTEKVGKLILRLNGEDATIAFVSTLELVSYIVLDVSKDMKDVILPTAEEVSYHWSKLHGIEKRRSCEELNVQFPNIYRLVSTSLDEVHGAMLKQAFIIKNHQSRVYLCGKCLFLEDLPKSITEEQLKTSITSVIGHKNVSSSSFYIQMNKRANSACIIVADKARKWATTTILQLGDRSVRTKDRLSCRLLVRSVPQKFAVHTIIQHRVFAGTATPHKHSGENLILDVTDTNVFKDCLRFSALTIDDTIFRMEEYNAENNPEDNEIDADTWYQTEMLRYKPDIMQFIDDFQHVIFRYKWNAQIWLDQLKRSLSHNGGSRENNHIRHLLRMTVMLNTIAVVRKKSYMVDDRQVKLDIDATMKTIVYDHRSKLKRGEKIRMTKTPHKSTYVKVTNRDCLLVYENLARSGKRPLLLNMASATSAGGGYRKGDGAQEENIFRRSDYFRSLDLDLDKIQKQRPERFHCSSNCQLDPLANHNTMYPMDEFGAMYTSGVTVFRQPENTGYAYMERSLEDVCVIGMAAYREPSLKGNKLTPKYAAGMRKKIENVFSIAFHHEHDCLVLSAFGCGAFKNPPDDVAELFRSVIEQYAGFFELIEFAIVDDHNAGHHINPKGNVGPFRILDGMVVQPIIPVNKPNTMFGPYRFLSDGSTIGDICIFSLTPCYFGAKCNEMSDSSHARQFSHPPLCTQACLTGTCTFLTDPVHMWSLIHPSRCQYGGECRNIDNQQHAQEFEHPSYCQAKGACQDTNEEHLKQYRHLPLCKFSLKCLDFQKHQKPHCDAYRHCSSSCPNRSHCASFHDKEHMDKYQHPFPPPCLFTPFHCRFYIELTQASDIRKLPQAVQQHCLSFAHVCRFGRTCKDTTPVHLEKSIHVARCLCPYGDKCNRLTEEDHLNSVTHPNICDIRRLCNFADKCHDRQNLEHITKFRHEVKFEDSGVVRCYDLNKGIDFVRNQTESIARVTSYVESQKWQSLPLGYISREIIDWIRTVQPVHRCNPIIFESIILHGHVMSRSYMENLKIPKFVAHSVLQHSRIRRIEALQIKSFGDHAKEYITALVAEEFEKNNFPASSSSTSTTGSLTFHTSSTTRTSDIKRKENLLSSTIHQKDMDALRTKAIEIAQASIKLHTNPAGIGYETDKKLGTDNTVFSVLGPHLGHYYGDIFIVFKREILHHPDANFSIQAATSFASGNAYQWRPWLGADPVLEDERVKLYHSSKLHASVAGYDYATALELITLTSHTLQTKSMDIDLPTILKRWLRVDSHQNIESHLPKLIPVDYIDHIYMTKNIFDTLNQATHTAIDALFKNRITITEHEGAVKEAGGSFGSMPSTQSRADYQTFVVDELIKRFGKRDENSLPRPIRGAVVTIPSSNFNDHLVLPLTVSQAYEQYCTNQIVPPTDSTTYIYWQVMNGDMMLTLANEPIDGIERQPNLSCLTCYIAAKPVTSDTHYHEHDSYLNNGLPFQHDMIIKKRRYAAKTDAFYTGCNTDDFMTFCLAIQSSTGMVTLSHAGPNAIYNHQKTSYKFDKSELDLAKLNFIHVSAGTNTVPIRNLIVCFEQEANLHPTFDQNFNKDASLAAASSTVAESKKPDDKRSASSLVTCSQNVNCLIQYSSSAADHNSKYSHPCRYSELCLKKESFLTHEPHKVSMCTHDKDCNQLHDPYHRASHRHTDMPDFLLPCRHQDKCYDKSGNHRTRYSHGEQVFEGISAAKSDESDNSLSEEEQLSDQDERTSCRWGINCRDIGDSQHCKTYSHPSSIHHQVDHGISCKWGAKCHDHSSSHRTKYSHPRGNDQRQRDRKSSESDDVNVLVDTF